MKKAFIILIGLLTFNVVACSPVYKTDYNYTPPSTHEGAMCVEHCNSMKNLCEQTCKAEESECKYEGKLDAQKEYDRYIRDRQKKGREIKKEKSDFEYASCGPASCTQECNNNYKSCYSSCGGVVNEFKKCTAFCN